jgi:hypothetical protein
MRINSDPPRVVTRPDVAPDVGAVGGTRAVGPVGSQVAGGAPAPSTAGAVTEREPAAPAPPPRERRAGSRRGADRRQKQQPVLVDMRVGQRRRNRRRNQDEPPPTIDLKA